MRRSVMLFLAWILLPAIALAAEPVQDWPITLQLDVNCMGQVTAAKVMGPTVPQTGDVHLNANFPRYKQLPEALAQRVEQATLNWKFQPITLAGIPVTGRTWATAYLRFAERKDGNVDVALQYLGNGPFMQHEVLPRPPVVMLRQMATGILDVEYVVEPDGSVDHIQALKAFGKVALYQGVFEQAVRKAFSASKGLPLLIDGKPVATRMRIPVTFFVGDGTADFDRERMLRKAWHALELKARKENSEDTSAPVEAVAVDSPFVLSAG